MQMKEPSQSLESLDLAEKLQSKIGKASAMVQTEVLRTMTKTLLEKGFNWILPVILSKCTDPLWPDPAASIEKRLEVDIYGEKVRTMQSMIVHKLVLSSLGPEKFFILSPNIRIEKRERAKTGWHLYEFTQLEIEISRGKMEDAFRSFEELIKSSVTAVKNLQQTLMPDRALRVPEAPFAVHRRRDLEEQYGKGWEKAISEKIVDPVWVTDLPREFYDFEDEATGSWRNFDLVLPEGYGEIISGAEREFEYEKMSKKLERDGVRKEDYAFLLKLAKDGKLKPSVGAGLGIERFIAYLCGVDHVAEVQPFPRVPGVVTEL